MEFKNINKQTTPILPKVVATLVVTSILLAVGLVLSPNISKTLFETEDCPNSTNLKISELKKLALEVEHDGKTECSIQLWKEVVKKRPADGKAAVNLAMRLTEAEHYKEALPYYEHSIKLGVGAYDAFAWYARTLKYIGKRPEAIIWYYRALSVNPKLSDITAELSELLVLEDRPYEALSLLGSYDKVIAKRDYFKARRISILTQITPKDKEVKSFTVAKSRNDHYFVYVGFSENKGLPFLIDTGASTLTLDEKLLNEMDIKYKIVKSDLKFKVADGRLITGKKIELSTFQVGPYNLNNVTAITCSECSSLVGQNILNQFDLTTKRKEGVEFLTMTPRDQQ